jgi:hypothetical protein
MNSGEEASGNWVYWLYTYGGSGNAEKITFTPKNFLDASGVEDKDYYMCLISQGGLGGPAGKSLRVEMYNGLTYNVTATGGSGGGAAGGQVYTNNFSTNKNEVTVTLYPCGTYTPSQYEYEDSNGDKKTIAVSYGTSGGNGFDGQINYGGDYDRVSGLYNISSIETGQGGDGGYTSNTGSGGDSNTSSVTYRYGGSGGNGGGYGTFSTPTPVNNVPQNGTVYVVNDYLGAGGGGISSYGGPAYGGTNGSQGVQSGSTQGSVGATTVKFADFTSGTIAAGGLGGYGGNVAQSGQAGNLSAFMFYYPY